MPPEEWAPYLASLAEKLGQYCYLMNDISGQTLEEIAGGDYEKLREYVRQRGIDAYYEKVRFHIFTNSERHLLSVKWWRHRILGSWLTLSGSSF